MTKILIAEDIPSHNKGEEALLLGLIKSVQNMAPCEFFMLSLNPEDDQQNYGDLVKIIGARGITPAHILDSVGSTAKKAFNITQFKLRYKLFAMAFKVLGRNALKIMPHPVWRSYCDADLVLMAHDSFFSPRYHGTLANFCHALKKPVAIYASTTENPLFHTPEHVNSAEKKALAADMSKVPLTLLRERISLENLKKIGLDPKKNNIHVHADLAFIVDPASPEDADAILAKEGIPRDRPLIGMTMTQRKTHFSYRHLPVAERMEKSMEAIAESIDFMTEKLGANIVFIPHSIGPSKILDDRIAAEMLRARAKNPEQIFSITTEYSVRELKALAGKLDMAVGARLHFIIDALCNNVPSLLITHIGDTRCHGIVGDMAGQEHWVYNIDSINGPEITALVKELWEKRDDVRKELENIMPGIKQDVYNHGKRLKEMFDNYKAN